MSTDNIRTIIGFIAADANAAEVPKFLPESVLGAAAKIAELTARVAELEAKPKTETPQGPVIKDSDNGDVFLYVAGHGYVLTTTAKAVDVIQLNNLGEIRSVHNMTLTGKRTYVSDSQKIEHTAAGTTWTLEFKPHGPGKRISSVTKKTPDRPTIKIESLYGPDNICYRTIYHGSNSVTENFRENDKIVKTIFTEGPVTTTTIGDSVVTETRLHPRVTLVKAAGRTLYKLATAAGDVVYTEHVDGAVRNGEAIPGGMSVRGATYKFRHGDTREKFVYFAGFLRDAC